MMVMIYADRARWLLTALNFLSSRSCANGSGQRDAYLLSHLKSSWAIALGYTEIALAHGS